MVFIGRVNDFDTRSQRSIRELPIRADAGIRILWSALAKSIRARWGTASPTKPIGPQNAAVVPAKRVVDRKIR